MKRHLPISIGRAVYCVVAASMWFLVLMTIVVVSGIAQYQSSHNAWSVLGIVLFTLVCPGIPLGCIVGVLLLELRDGADPLGS